jgi:hypothetical protein
LPFLRFTRDKRGYESTFLVHTARRRGKSRQQILYWFRSPPDVKVGRGALDEDAIRSIEESNPDVAFDWPKILEARPEAPAVSQIREPRRRVRRPADGSSRPAPRAAEPPRAAVEAPGPAAEPRQSKGRGRGRQAKPAEREAPEVVGPQLADAGGLDVEAVAPGPPEEPRPAIETAIGREQAARLRARFAELQARITERGGDAARIEALRLDAESLDPDAWVTAEEARKGLETFEARIQEFRRTLGLGRHRRSRRGGVRHRRRAGGAPTSSNGAAAEGGPNADSIQAGPGAEGPGATGSPSDAPGADGDQDAD